MNDELKKQIAEIELEAKKRIEEICKKAMEEDEQPSRVWKPKHSDKVWYWSYINERPIYVIYHNEDHIIRSYEAGDMFPTEEACKEAQKAKVIQAKWKRLAAKSGEGENWYAYYDTRTSEIEYEMNLRCASEITYFASAEAIKAAVAEIGEENIKEYILGMKEE